MIIEQKKIVINELTLAIFSFERFKTVPNVWWVGKTASRHSAVASSFGISNRNWCSYGVLQQVHWHLMLSLNKDDKVNILLFYSLSCNWKGGEAVG